jgi:hypothetical protein
MDQMNGKIGPIDDTRQGQFTIGYRVIRSKVTVGAKILSGKIA